MVVLLLFFLLVVVNVYETVLIYACHIDVMPPVGPRLDNKYFSLSIYISIDSSFRHGYTIDAPLTDHI